MRAGPMLAQDMGLTGSPTLDGRTGVIFCDDQPAIAVLEILSPTE